MKSILVVPVVATLLLAGIAVVQVAWPGLSLPAAGPIVSK
jgi:hypothetical protein